MRDAEFDRSRTTNQDNPEYTVDENDAEIQRGNKPRPQFYGDQSMTGSHSSFSSAVGLASSFAGIIGSIRENTVDSRGQDDQYRLTKAEMAELVKVAKNIATYGNIPFDVVEDFLIILCYIDTAADLHTIAVGVQVEKLDDPSLIRQPFAILAVPDLFRIAYAASAVEGLINTFRRFLLMAQNSPQETDQNIDSLLSALSGVLGALGGSGGASARLNNQDASDALGHFMSELITGKRIPMTVIAKNPALQSPSFIGKAMFGEAPTALSNIDITQVFNKKIGSFPKPSNGAGTTSFGIQNLGGFASSMNIPQIASKLLFGNAPATSGSKKERQVAAAADKMTTLTGSNTTETMDIRRADTAIPLLAAFSAVVSGTDKSIFPTTVFQQGWQLSNSVSNYLQTNGSTYLEAIKRFT